MNDAILIVPPFPNIAAQKGFEMTRPMGLFCLAATLKRGGYKVQIKHFEKDGGSGKDIASFLLSHKARLYGVTSTTATRFGALEVIRQIKKIHPESICVAGGPHFGNCIDDSLNTVPEIDMIVRGEGDYTLLNLLRALEDNGGVSGIKGISYRKNGRITHNPDSEIIANLDDLPVYDDFKYENYRETLFVVEEKVPAISMLTSRGCPYRCIFCSVGHSGYRYRSPEKVADEIEFWLNKFPGVRGINFFDLTFTAVPAHTNKICSEIIRRKLKFMWWAESRVTIDPGTLLLMRKAGCVALSAGVESGSEKIIKNISKDISLPQVHNFVRFCKNAGIEPLLFFMVSHPDETTEDLSQTKKLIFDLLPETKSIALSTVSIYPGTKLETIAKEKNIIPGGFSWNAPFYSRLSERLTPYPDIPVFLDKLTSCEIEDFIAEVRAARFKTKIKSNPLHYLIRAIKLLFTKEESMGTKIRVGIKFIASCLKEVGSR